jgi:hypothetical protein
MSEEREIRGSEGRIEHPDAPYEEKDIRVGCILALIIATGCVFVIIFAIDWYFFHAQKRSEARDKQSPYPLANPMNPLPPAPRLDQIDRMEVQPGQSYYDQLAKMERQLHSSGLTDEKGFVHIPIEQAMREIVKQLPVRREPAKSADAGHPGGSNSGRMLLGAPSWSEY